MVNTRSIRLLSFLLLFATASLNAISQRSNDEYQWKPDQVKVVIDQKTALMLDSWIDRLFKPEKTEDIQTIRSILYSGIVDNPDYFADKTYNGHVIRLYSKTRVPQVIYSVTLDYIADKAHKYAFDQLASHELAKIIKELIIKDASERMATGPTTEPDLSTFLGKDLKIKIDIIIERRGWVRAGLALPKPQPVPVAITSDDKCESGLGCENSVVVHGKRLTWECGHSPICLSCAKQYIVNKMKTCPKCLHPMTDIQVSRWSAKVGSLASEVQEAQIAADKRAAA